MRETIFNSEVIASLKAAGAWAYKIADSPASWTMSRTRFTVDKPCDILACAPGGRLVAVEGKQLKAFRAFGLREMRPSQISNLDRITACGGQAFIFLNVRIRGKRGPVVNGRWTGANYENRLIVLPWARWRVLLDILPLSKEELRALPYIAGKKGLFDLRPFLAKISK